MKSNGGGEGGGGAGELSPSGTNAATASGSPARAQSLAGGSSDRSPSSLDKTMLRLLETKYGVPPEFEGRILPEGVDEVFFRAQVHAMKTGHEWIRGCPGYGLIELEILRRLTDKSKETRTFFFLRSPDYIKHLKDGGGWLSMSNEEREGVEEFPAELYEDAVSLRLYDTGANLFQCVFNRDDDCRRIAELDRSGCENRLDIHHSVSPNRQQQTPNPQQDDESARQSEVKSRTPSPKL